MAQDRVLVEELGRVPKDHRERYRFASAGISGRVLDAACGCGYGSRMLYGVANEVVGIDIYPNAVKFAAEHYKGPTYKCGDLETVDLGGKFDFVVSLETIEHLKNPELVLKRFREVGGALIASVPNEEVTPFKPEDWGGHDYPHLRHYTPSQFHELLEGAGWKVAARYCQESKSDWPVKEGTDGRFLVYICK